MASRHLHLPSFVKRDLTSLANTDFDVLVVGGGVLGACVARDAALRGLKTALLERRDFAGGTSWNSLKIVHGGLRALQQLNLPRAREFIRERSTWFRIAPHLIDPLPVLVPTYGYGMQSRQLLRAALAVNDLVGWDRNRGVESERTLPSGRVLSRRECVELVPELESPRPTGAVVFYDGQMYSSERLILELLRSASDAGALVANYVEARGALVRHGRTVGARVGDALGTGGFDVRARVIINAAGSAAPTLAGRLTGRASSAATDYSVALNLMVESLGHPVGFALDARVPRGAREARYPRRKLLIVPWRGRTLIGTAHLPYSGDPACFQLDEADVERFLNEVNAVWTGEPFSRGQVLLIHAGLLPLARGTGGAEVRLLKQSEIVDHAAEGVPEVISVVAVKYTTSRLVAERAVDLTCRKLGLNPRPCRTAETLLPGAPTSSVAQLMADASRAHAALLPPHTLEHLVRTYGTEYSRILGYRSWLPDWDAHVVEAAPVIKAQLVHGAREELAQVADDLVQRRTELGARALATDAALRSAADALALKAAPAAV